MLQGKVLVAQGGGPTAVINQSLVGTITESRKFSAVSNVYGSLHGISGIVNEDFLDLTQETTTNLFLNQDKTFQKEAFFKTSFLKIIPHLN